MLICETAWLSRWRRSPLPFSLFSLGVSSIDARCTQSPSCRRRSRPSCHSNYTQNRQVFAEGPPWRLISINHDPPRPRFPVDNRKITVMSKSSSCHRQQNIFILELVPRTLSLCVIYFLSSIKNVRVSNFFLKVSLILPSDSRLNREACCSYSAADIYCSSTNWAKPGSVSVQRRWVKKQNADPEQEEGPVCLKSTFLLFKWVQLSTQTSYKLLTLTRQISLFICVQYHKP